MAMMDLKPNDILFDLGCGDGRLLIRAATQVDGLRCVGVEMDALFVERANKAIAQLPETVQQRIQIRCQDVTQILNHLDAAAEAEPTSATTTDGSNGNTDRGNTAVALVSNELRNVVTIANATVIYLYLLPRGLRQIKDMLDNLVQRRIEKGQSLRIVAYTFSVPTWEPTRVDTSTKSGVPIYLYEFTPRR